jgi:hypothetical protein
MKKIFAFIILLLIAAGIAFYVYQSNKKTPVNQSSTEVQPQAANENSASPDLATPSASASLDIPLSKAVERITKKPFGIYVTPQNSPVQPERFTGFHTGTDFEIFPGEENQSVSILAICNGKIIFKNTVGGYGGVIIQACVINNEAVTVLYGHLSLAKSPALMNTEYKKGDIIAILGQGFSAETSGERKHLHLGIHKGNDIEFRGYVQNEKDLSVWLDFQQIFGLK